MFICATCDGVGLTEKGVKHSLVCLDAKLYEDGCNACSYLDGKVYKYCSDCWAKRQEPGESAR